MYNSSAVGVGGANSHWAVSGIVGVVIRVYDSVCKT